MVYLIPIQISIEKMAMPLEIRPLAALYTPPPYIFFLY